MTNRTANASPQLDARIAGVLYLINIGCGIFDEVFVRSHRANPMALRKASMPVSLGRVFRMTISGPGLSSAEERDYEA